MVVSELGTAADISGALQFEILLISVISSFFVSPNS